MLFILSLEMGMMGPNCILHNCAVNQPIEQPKALYCIVKDSSSPNTVLKHLKWHTKPPPLPINQKHISIQRDILPTSTYLEFPETTYLNIYSKHMEFFSNQKLQ